MYTIVGVGGVTVTVRAHVHVSGMVQGVFYRAFTARRADEAGLTGWVRNLGDGRVEAVFEGREEDVEAILGWCHDGPPHAEVTAVEVAWEQPRGERGFSVR